MLKKLLLFSAVLTGLMFCLNWTMKEGQAKDPVMAGNSQIPAEIRSNCYVCHNPGSPSHDAILAPPLAVVKTRYANKYQTRSAFVDNMVSFLIKPTKEKAIMYGAVDRFGLMPPTVFDDSTTRKIAEYIYENKLEEPTWLAEEMRSQTRPAK